MTKILALSDEVYENILIGLATLDLGCPGEVLKIKKWDNGDRAVCRANDFDCLNCFRTHLDRCLVEPDFIIRRQLG